MFGKVDIVSRVGKSPIVLPEKIDVEILGSTVKVKGSKGQLEYTFTDKVKIKKVDRTIVVIPVNDDQEVRALWGTTRSLINNMVVGVTEGFTKELEYNGVGYKAVVKGDLLVLNLGYSHPINYKLPQGVQAKVVKNVISLSGCNKELVGFAAAKIRSFRCPEPYKGKGIRYVGEVIVKKAGKTGAKK